jgi:hypothetical protein
MYVFSNLQGFIAVFLALDTIIAEFFTGDSNDLKETSAEPGANVLRRSAKGC